MISKEFMAIVHRYWFEYSFHVINARYAPSSNFQNYLYDVYLFATSLDKEIDSMEYYGLDAYEAVTLGGFLEYLRRRALRIASYDKVNNEHFFISNINRNGYADGIVINYGDILCIDDIEAKYPFMKLDNRLMNRNEAYLFIFKQLIEELEYLNYIKNLYAADITTLPKVSMTITWKEFEKNRKERNIEREAFRKEMESKKEIGNIKTLEDLNYYLHNTESITSDEWVQLTNISASITGLNKEDIENNLGWLKSKAK